MTNDSVSIKAIGHLYAVDDLGEVLIDQGNAIHPQNMARIFARGLANEPNSFIHRIAFGNGGTIVDAAYTVTYKEPNDGQSPDTNTWDSRLYNETYSEIVDEGQITLNPLIGTDPGSADYRTGPRAGGGAVPASDPPSTLHVSGPGVRSQELGLISQVVISSTLNGDEPRGQFASDTFPETQNTESQFVFDEIGLYTSGAQAIPTKGYQYIDVGTRTSTDDCGLLPGLSYSFNIRIDGGSVVLISFTVPVAGGSGVGGQVLYGDFAEAINTGDPDWGLAGSNPLPGGARVLITDQTAGAFPSIAGAQTFGFLKFESPNSGVTSAVSLTGTQTTAFVASLNPPLGAQLVTPVAGSAAGFQNSPITPTQERERLLTHLIFSPVLKAKNRTITFTYTLTISVARSPH